MREQEISLRQYEGDIDEENLGNRGEKVKFFRDEGNMLMPARPLSLLGRF